MFRSEKLLQTFTELQHSRIMVINWNQTFGCFAQQNFTEEILDISADKRIGKVFEVD